MLYKDQEILALLVQEISGDSEDPALLCILPSFLHYQPFEYRNP